MFHGLPGPYMPTTVGMIRCRLGTTTTHVSIQLVKVIQIILTRRDILYPYG